MSQGVECYSCLPKTAWPPTYFKEEVLDIMPDIPRDELSEMVGEYIYYQQADVSKNEAHMVVEETCITK